jgi:hypothetical protein
LPWFCPLGEEPGEERCIFDDDVIAGASIESNPVRTELLHREDARRGVVAIEEVCGVACGRVGKGMRTLVHKQRVYSVTVGALEAALQILLNLS